MFRIWAVTGKNPNTSARSLTCGALRLDFQWLATVLAVNRVRFMAAQATFRALMPDLGGLEDGARQLQEKRDTHNHDEYRQKLSTGRRHGDIAEARGRQRRHREIERVDIAGDASLFIEGQHEDERRGNEDEDEQVHCSDDGVFVAAEEMTFAPEIPQQVVGVKQPQASKHAQKGNVCSEKRGKQHRRHDEQIRQSVDPGQFPAQVVGNPASGRKVQENKKAERDVQRRRDRRNGQRCGRNEIQYGQRIEKDQSVPKPPGALALSGVEQPDRSVQFLHNFNMSHVVARDHAQDDRLAC